MKTGVLEKRLMYSKCSVLKGSGFDTGLYFNGLERRHVPVELLFSIVRGHLHTPTSSVVALANLCTNVRR